jgi:cytochrome P450
MKERTYPPGPRSRLPGGAYFALHRDPLGALARAVRDYGDIVHLRLGPRHDYLLNHPDHVRSVLLAPTQMRRSLPRALKPLLGRGLLTCPEDFHRRERRLLQPAFGRQVVATYADAMVDCAARASSRWSEGQSIEVAAAMLDLALAIVVRTLFGSDIEKDAGAVGGLVDAIVAATDKDTIPFLDQVLARLPLSRTRRLARATRAFRDFIGGLLAARPPDGSRETDLLGFMRSHREANGDPSFSDAQIMDEAVTMVVTGHETIGTAIAWTWFLLSEHPEVEARVHAELDDMLAGRSPCYGDLHRLPYLDRVFSESMRLYPPVWLIVRRPERDVCIGGYDIPAGSYLHMSQFVVHRDPRFYPEPERFDPDRWTPTAEAARPPHWYFPFGMGSRRCIGETFARVEGLLVLATIAQSWRLRMVSGHPVELQPLITLSPKHGLAMTVHRRQRAPARA